MNLPAAKHVGIWGGPWKGAQASGTGAGVEVPTSPQGQAGVQAGDGGRGRLGQGYQVQLGAPLGTADALGPAGQQHLGWTRAIRALSRCRQLPAPSRGQLCQAGAHRHAGAGAGVAAATGGQPLLAKNTLTFTASPHSRHRGARHAALGTTGERGTGAGCRISPLSTRGTRLGGHPLACGGSWQCPPRWAVRQEFLQSLPAE